MNCHVPREEINFDVSRFDMMSDKIRLLVKLHNLSCRRGRQNTQTTPNRNLPATQSEFPPVKFANFRASKSPLGILGVALGRGVVPYKAHRCVRSHSGKQHIEEARHAPGYRKSDQCR